jgi:tellurite resistance protein TehA-like permease
MLRRASNRSEGLANATTPAAGSAVMATGIVSVALLADSQDALSRALLTLSAIAWVLLGLVFLHRLRGDPRRWRRDTGTLASLTAVAATAVLGVRLTLLGWSWAGWATLAIATTLYVVLGWLLVASRPLLGTGASFLLAVAPQSLVVLAASLADRLSLAWPLVPALLLFALGMAAYVVVLAHFEFGELRTGVGDQWVAGGALAISTLACVQIAQAAGAAHTLSAIHQALRVGATILWALTMLWLPLLIVAEVRWPRRRYDVARWATVFPLGMYSVMSISTGVLVEAHWIRDFGEASAWVALAAWSAAAIGAALRLMGA